MAADERGGFLKLGVSDVEIGKPLLHPLYDGSRNVILKRGHVVENGRQCEMLVQRGLYRSVHERPAVPTQRVSDDAPPSRESIMPLEATKIRIGSPLQMQSSADAPRLAVRLIGYLRGTGLIVTVPEADGELVMLKDGQAFIMRFFSGQNAYAFTSTVVKQTSVPFPHVHLSFPREVRGLEIRKGARIDVELIAAIAMEGEAGGEAKAGSAKIVNLSTGGAALRSKLPLGNKGDVINIKFKVMIHDIQSYLVFDSIIRTVTEDKSIPNMPYLHGVQFEHGDQGMVLALAAFVYQKIVHE